MASNTYIREEWKMRRILCGSVAHVESDGADAVHGLGVDVAVLLGRGQMGNYLEIINYLSITRTAWILRASSPSRIRMTYRNGLAGGIAHTELANIQI